MHNAMPITQALLHSLRDDAGPAPCEEEEPARCLLRGADLGATIARQLIGLAEYAHKGGDAEVAGRLVEIAQDLLDSRFAGRTVTFESAQPGW